MASRSDIRAGRAHVELYLKNSALVKGLQSVKAEMQKWSSALMGLGATTMKIGAGITTAFGGVALAFAKPIQLAGDLMETTSKFESVFGTGAAAMKVWGDEYARQIGRSKSDTMSALATFGSFFSGLGVGGDEAQNLSKKMQSLSVDFASFHNLQDAEAQQRFISALSGSGEVLSMFGVNIMQSALDLKLLEMGFKKSTAGATEMQKVLARIAIINESMGRQGAVGDAAKTAGSFSNQMKKLWGEVKNAGEAIGNALLPVVTPLVTWLAKAGTMVAEWAAKNQKLIVTIAKVAAVGAVIGGAITAMGALIFGAGAGIAALGTVISGVISAVTLIAPLVVALMTPVGALVAAIVVCGVTLAGMAVYWVAFTDEGQRAAKAVLATFAPVVEFLKGISQGVADALMAGEIELAGKIVMAGLHLAFMEGVNSIVGEIWRIPKAFADMANTLPVWAQQLSGIRPFVVASMAAGAAGQLVQNTAPLRQQLEDLKLVAAWDREVAAMKATGTSKFDSVDEYVPGGPAADAVAKLKAFGSFNPVALEMQNWGGIAPGVKKDPAKEMLDKIYQENVYGNKLAEKTIEAIKRGYTEYGE